MLSPDFKELLILFNGKSVRYLLVGGYSLAVHGVPRYTGDMDLWLERTEDNSRKVLQALEEFGLGSLGLGIEDFLQTDQVIQLGYPPLRIDLLTGIDGLEFPAAWEKRISVSMEGLEIPVISLEDLIRNKEASGRQQDLADLERLRNLRS